MTEKRFKVHSMIQDMEVGEIIDLELCEDLIKKYGSLSDIHLLIEDNGNDMTYQEVVDLLNKLNDEVKSQSLVIEGYQNRNEKLSEEIARQKFSKEMMRDNIKDYEKSIKRLRKSYEKFDEMRLRRIRFLEERLKKNGLSIYVNDAGDVE